MRQDGFVFKSGDLVHEKQGTRIAFEIKERLGFDFGLNIKPVSLFSAEIVFMKIDGGIHAHIKNAHIDFEFTCTKCGKKYTEEVYVDEAERVYFFERRKENGDVFDNYYVDLKNMTIDISEFIRQEIILHFPTIPVCSSSCKGLCPICGADLNDSSCSCGKLESEQTKPLAILKTLYNAKASGTEKKDL